MIRVIIERQIAESLEEIYDERARSSLRKAVDIPGFISGESLRGSDNPNHRVVLSTWRSANHWHRWHNSPERRAMMAQIRPMLEGDERIIVLEHVGAAETA